MKQLSATVSALALMATMAGAGGIDRSGQSVAVIFENGKYAEFSLGYAAPSVSGTAVAALGGFDSGDMAGNYVTPGLAYKQNLGSSVDVAIIVDQPFGANVDYPTGTGYYAAGSVADLNTTAITGLLQYTLQSNVSVFGGLRYQTMEATASVPFVSSYTADGEKDDGLGYLVGVAYEKPEIALRVALTYNSEIEHSLATDETSAALGAASSSTEIVTPQSINLEFQSGVAPDTLVFGSIRWVEWSKFDISPAMYSALTGGGSLVSYDDDTISYTLGIGRKFNDTWSGALSVGYESQTGGFASNLGPTDGYWSIGLGGTYTKGNVKISGGVRYVGIGDARTQLPGTAPAANFTDNSALAVGIKVGVTF